MDYVEIDNDAFDPPKSGILQTRECRVGAHIVPFDELEGFIATYLCGRYPTMSNRDMKYIFVLFDYDSNEILSQPMKSKKGSAIIAAYDSIYNELSDASIILILQYLDNEISKELTLSIK